ncbi:hypothetical protein KC341_g32 [Hortaea werneckii]|nr:hypothetical protein KC341_g32 [Hortaea werneckii]
MTALRASFSANSVPVIEWSCLSSLLRRNKGSGSSGCLSPVSRCGSGSLVAPSWLGSSSALSDSASFTFSAFNDSKRPAFSANAPSTRASSLVPEAYPDLLLPSRLLWQMSAVMKLEPASGGLDISSSWSKVPACQSAKLTGLNPRYPSIPFIKSFKAASSSPSPSNTISGSMISNSSSSFAPSSSHAPCALPGSRTDKVTASQSIGEARPDLARRSAFFLLCCNTKRSSSATHAASAASAAGRLRDMLGETIAVQFRRRCKVMLPGADISRRIISYLG